MPAQESQASFVNCSLGIHVVNCACLTLQLLANQNRGINAAARAIDIQTTHSLSRIQRTQSTNYTFIHALSHIPQVPALGSTLHALQLAARQQSSQGSLRGGQLRCGGRVLRLQRGQLASEALRCAAAAAPAGLHRAPRSLSLQG